MRLDYNARTRAFILRVPRGEGDVRDLMIEHGLDFSDPASSPDEAVLFTKEPYAAASFAKYGTPAACAELKVILSEVKESWRDTSKAHIRCPADQELWSFQKAAVEYAMRRQHTLVGDQPGLGKTATAICYANEMRAKRVLVICPANIRLQWAHMVARWTTMRWPYTVYPILTGAKGVHPSAEWTIISYDLCRNEHIGRALTKGHYDLLILDEAHYLKTIDSQRTRAVFGDSTGYFRRLNSMKEHEIVFDAIASKCENIMGLTGTPLPNRPREAYTIARAFCPDSIDFMSEDSFRERFNPSMMVEGTRKDGSTYMFTREEAGRHGELQMRLRSNFMVRREKRTVMPQLKLPIFDIIYVEKDQAVKQALAAESLLDIDPENFAGADVEVMGHIAVVRHMMGLAMAPHVGEYLAMLYDGGEDKIVVFGWHIDVLDILEKRLERITPGGVVRIDGSVSPTKKHLLKERFIKEAGVHWLLGNMMSAGTGTDGLQEVATHALFAENSWTAGENQQCVDRLDRAGQMGQVQADFFVAPGSISEKILASSLRKLKTTHKVLDRRV